MVRRDVKSGSYVTIQAWMVNDLKLSGHELMVYAVIYGFSQDGESWYRGPKSYLGSWCGASDTTVWRCLKSLKHKGLIESREVDVDGVRMYDYKAITPFQNEMGTHCKMKYPPFQNEMPYITIKDNKDIECTDTSIEGIKTELNRGDKTYLTDNGAKERGVFERIWYEIPWQQRQMFSQTREFQWEQSKDVLKRILGQVDGDSLFGRIRDMTHGTFVMDKAVSFWLKDNEDALVARNGDMSWTKMN